MQHGMAGNSLEIFLASREVGEGVEVNASSEVGLVVMTATFCLCTPLLLFLLLRRTLPQLGDDRRP